MSHLEKSTRRIKTMIMRTVITNKQYFQGVLQLPNTDSSPHPHCPRRWVLWFTESQTSVIVTGLNSQALTPNPIFSLKCLLKKKFLSHQPAHLGHLKTSSKNSPGQHHAFSKNKHLQKETKSNENQILIASGFSSGVASLSSFSLFHVKSYNCQGELWAFQRWSRDMSLGKATFKQRWSPSSLYQGQVHIHALTFCFTEFKVSETVKDHFCITFSYPAAASIAKWNTWNTKSLWILSPKMECTFWGYQFIQDHKTTLGKKNP